ncbi:MAG: EI24 domain-containing protein [Oscillochloridaceae bacterium umkhey_bin13]
MQELLTGVSYPLRALQLINQQRQLWGFVIVPILVNLVVGAALYLGLYALLLGQLRARWGDFSEGWAGALVAVLGVLLAVLLAIGISFVLVRFGVVLGAPWYSQLSEEIEALLVGRASEAVRPSPGRIVIDIWRALLFEVKKLSLFLVCWLPSLLLLLIPGLGGPLQMGVGILLGALISCLDFFDGPQERRRMGFRQKLATVRRLMPGSLSFGVVAAALVAIPLVNLLAIPLCVTAGNLYVIERGRLQTTL